MSGTHAIETPVTDPIEPQKVNLEKYDFDLEDGEIDDDDDDNVVAAKEDVTKNTDCTDNTLQDRLVQNPIKSIDALAIPVVTIDLSNESTSFTSPTTKSKKSQLIEDDHASSIENAIASALKKKGIEPPMPKILEMRVDFDNAEQIPSTGHGQSRSSRRRKRKKQRDEKEKEKERKEKKRHRFESPEQKATGASSTVTAPPSIGNEDELDDYEMLNVRGGSPPPAGNITLTPGLMPVGKECQYDSAVDSCSSYDSYDSELQRYEGRRAAGVGNKPSKESRKSRRERTRARDDRDDRNGRGAEKRNRRDSPNEDKQYRGQEPRKLELCKFYLMECCAKKDKCSYMHSDFPCKYYYLGMECVYGSLCKFSHGEPLTEQLRNILLKHLETAPKEILGSFKRICRDTAITQIAARHAELCKEFNVDNTLLTLPISNHNSAQSSRTSNGGATGSDHHQHHPHHQQQQQQQLQHQQTQSAPIIPSLLDIVIKPPTDSGVTSNISQQKEKQQRKSRWCDSSNSGNNINSTSSSNNIEPPSSSTLSYLELKNLTGILSAEHIEKLSQLGIVNLEQVNQLTFGQLNKIGLTIAEISEIQVNAINMAKGTVNNAKKSTTEKIDVDMRFLPSGGTRKETTSLEADVLQDKDIAVSSNSNSNSSNSGVVLVDYSQYLKDSNLTFDRGDLLDDEKDEEQLVIDDDDTVEAEDVSNTQSADLKNVEKPGTQLVAEIINRLHQLPESRRRIPSPTLKNLFSSFSSKQQNAKVTKDSCDSVEMAVTSSTTSFNVVHKSNPFRAHNSDDNSSESSRDALYRSEHRVYNATNDSRSSRSRSATPTRFSNSSESPEPRSPAQMAPVYERPSMYDYSNFKYDEYSNDLNKSTKADKDMRRFQDSASSDIDLRLPFQPVTNYIPATEIDASITSHSHILYKVYECDVPRPKYTELRQSFISTETHDPRLRRIIGLPELSKTNTAAALSRTDRSISSSINISSPETEGASPSYYIPPTTSNYATIHSEVEREDRGKSNKPPSAAVRLDPRRAAAAAVTSASSSSISSSIKPTASSCTAQRQNIEIRNLLQRSDWYKNLNSKFKIMVNQQLALVSTELKKFHLDASPDKIFDIQFIVGNPYLQQILTNLGIYIDDNGEVAYVENDNEHQISRNTLPNLNQMPPNVQHKQQMDFLRGPPPIMPPIGALQNIYTGPPTQHMGMPTFSGGAGQPNSPNIMALNARPSLLGMPPISAANVNPFNPFGNVAMIDINNAASFGNAGPNAGMIAGPGFPNFSCVAGPNMSNLQRNFNHQKHNRQQNNRRNNYGGKGNGGNGAAANQRQQNQAVNNNNFK